MYVCIYEYITHISVVMVVVLALVLLVVAVLLLVVLLLVLVRLGTPVHHPKDFPGPFRHVHYENEVPFGAPVPHGGATKTIGKSPAAQIEVLIYIYITYPYIHIHIHIYMYIYIYMWGTFLLVVCLRLWKARKLSKGDK